VTAPWEETRVVTVRLTVQRTRFFGEWPSPGDVEARVLQNMRLPDPEEKSSRGWHVAEAAECPDLAVLPWRQGRRKGRNLYAITGEDWEAHPEIGCLDTPELAAEAVAAHNERLGRLLPAAEPLELARLRDVTEVVPAFEDEPDVHVDWHMTPGEWSQLHSVLLRYSDVPYIARLIAEGKVPYAPYCARAGCGHALGRHDDSRPGMPCEDCDPASGCRAWVSGPSGNSKSQRG
jgi:hypothetical protein